MVTTGIVNGPHFVNDWEVKMGRETFNVLPSITQTKVSWSSESAASHPDPSRSSTIIVGPRVAVEALGLDLNQGMRMFVAAEGLDVNLSPVMKNVAYMEGLIDGVELARVDSKGTRFATMPHSVTVSGSTPDVTVVSRPDGLFDVTSNSDVEQDVQLTVFTDPSLSTGRVSQGQYAGGPVKYAGMVRTRSQDSIWRNDVVVGPSRGQTVTLPGGNWHSFPARVRNMQAGQTVTIMVVGVEQPSHASMGSLERLEAVVVASDYLATLGRLTVGDEPWPYRRVSERIYHDLAPLADASGVYLDWYPSRVEGAEPGGVDMVNSNWVRPLDVDSRSALDIYRLTCASVGRVALGLAGRVGMSWALKPSYRLTYMSGQMAFAAIVTNPDSTMIPSAYVPDAPVAKAADRVATKINVTWWRPGPDYAANDQDVAEQNFILTDPTAIRRYGVIERKVETHQFTTRMDYTLRDIAPELVVKTQLMLDEQAEPEWYFSEGTRVIPRNLDEVQGLAEIIDNATRFGRVVRFTGPMPHGVDDSHRCIGGSFGFDGEDWRLELELEPAYYAGTDTAKFFQAAPKTDLTFGVLSSSSNASGTGPITYAEMRNTAL